MATSAKCSRRCGAVVELQRKASGAGNPPCNVGVALWQCGIISKTTASDFIMNYVVGWFICSRWSYLWLSITKKQECYPVRKAENYPNIMLKQGF